PPRVPGWRSYRAPSSTPCNRKAMWRSIRSPPTSPKRGRCSCGASGTVPPRSTRFARSSPARSELAAPPLLKKPLFYGWWMVAAGCAMQFLQSCLLLQAFGAYVAILRDDRGWSKTELAGAAALHQVEAAVLGPLLGWVIDRFGAQGVMRTGVLIFGIGFMLFSQIDTLLGFYGAFIVLALGASLAGFFPLNVALIHWFERKRARALSSVQFGFALGGIAMPAVAWSLATFGWRATAFVSGVLIIVLGFPLSLVIRRRPEDFGERADGEPAPPPPEASDAAAADPVAPARDFTAREALRTPAFWLLALGHGFALFVVSAVNVHAITHM